MQGRNVNIIYRYAVVEMSDKPMYGRDKTLGVFLDKDRAISKAKQLSVDNRNICVECRRYASESNLKKSLTVDQSLCWAAWLNENRNGGGAQ